MMLRIGEGQKEDAMKVLVTGGPVHAYLDDVKVITNKFHGGLMAGLVDDLSSPNDITYLCPTSAKRPAPHPNVSIMFHDGFDDYRKRVLDLAPQMDAVVLGAAVANLIPAERIHGKFPSHHYTVGERFPVMFTIAPRVIDEVRKVAPKTKLFGFKLLSNAPHAELVTAAYGVLLSSGATAIIANDASDLKTKYVITKERTEIPLKNDQLAAWLMASFLDVHYKTVRMTKFLEVPASSAAFFWKLAEEYAEHFTPTPEGMLFGSVSVRVDAESFITTPRKKTVLSDYVLVGGVDHNKREVSVPAPYKASLNAPLMAGVFAQHPEVHYILHFHDDKVGNLPVVPYAPPGTVRDSQRMTPHASFYIEHHGSVLSYTREGMLVP